MTERALAAYLEWLSAQITPNRPRNFEELFYQLSQKEFFYVLAEDNSRIQDVHELRHACFREFDVKPYVTTDVLGPVSVLEVMVALSKRLAYQTDSDAGQWAWQLMINLQLDRYSGRISRRLAEEIDGMLDRLIWRQYQPDGVGGFFPLAWPQRDQTDVELWYQMSAYLEEQEIHDDPHGSVQHA
jgi:hypothetical protein